MQSRRKIPEQEVLCKLLRYDPDTGSLFWRERDESFFPLNGKGAVGNAAHWNRRFYGKPAFSCRGRYMTGSILGKNYSAHRIIWKMMTGLESADEIDHINGNNLDNRIENLRVASRLVNARNTKKSKKNSSGVTGVTWSVANKKWVAYIGTSSMPGHYVGSFVEFSDAVDARIGAEKRAGYHENHGREVHRGRQ